MTVTASSTHGTVVTTGFPPPVSRRARTRWRSVAIALTTLVAAATLAAVTAALVVSARDVWYDNLQRPGWIPSADAFVVAATAVYLVLGLAGWRIWVRAPGSVALTAWLVQLGLHLTWMVLFFGLWVPQWSLVEAAVLAGVALATIAAARRSTRLGTALLVPVLAWIAYLVAVNAAVVAWN
jgi:tryptophan-rich sensory protein